MSNLIGLLIAMAMQSAVTPPAAAGPAALRPLGNPAHWVREEDYPPEALQQQRGGRVRVALGVGLTGRVEHCVIVDSSGHSDLDQATCRAFTRRARFQPERDGNGQPVRSQYRTTWLWSVGCNDRSICIGQ